MDKIIIEGLELQAIIGVYDWERTQTQTVRLDLVLSTDFRQAMSSDDVADTIDYGKVVEAIETLVNQQQPELLEHLAEMILELVFSRFKPQDITLKITKPDVLPQTQSVGIQLFRTASDYQ